MNRTEGIAYEDSSARRPRPAADEAIVVESVSKAFYSRGERYDTVSDASFAIGRGEVVSLVGPSGCGKSTLLNIIAGLVDAASGRVVCDGKVITGPNTGVGYLTQDDALLPWRTVRSNVGLPLEIRGVSRRERGERAGEMIGRVGLSGFERHYPGQLSGGMRKRVSLARTLVSDVDTLLLDEPFGALDAQTRTIIQRLLTRLVETMHLSVLLVTHDLDEAIALSDRVIVLSRRPGRILDIVTIPLERPRDVTQRSDAHVAVYRRVWEVLADQLDADALESDADSSSRPKRAGRRG